jgi:hypothetical protein
MTDMKTYVAPSDLEQRNGRVEVDDPFKAFNASVGVKAATVDANAGANLAAKAEHFKSVGLR